MIFFEISSAIGRGFWEGEFDPYPNLRELVLGTSMPEEVRVVVRKGKRPGDTIGGSFGVFSGRFVKVLEEIHATGYRACPIEVVVERDERPDYHVVKITGRGGPLDMERSGATRSELGNLSHREIHMIESEWDGSDVFVIPELGILMFVVDRVATALKDAGLKNVVITPNTECTAP